MRKKYMFKKTIIAATVVLSMLTFTGCSMTMDMFEKTTVEEEVADALDAPEDDYVIEPESALEYVEIEEPDAAAMTDDALDTVPMEMSEADELGNTETAVEESEEIEDTLQIVFIGDSIFDSVRDETGIASLIASDFGADVYNLAIGGTTAGLRKDKSTDKATWNEPSMMGVLYTMTGEITNGLLDGYKSGEVMKTLDPKKTDYFIIQYGTNDFLWYIPLGAADYQGQYYYYFRTSLNMGIELLKEKYPDAKILLCTPYYEEYWSADRSRFIGDVHSVNNGYGTLLDYISVVQDAAEDYDVECLNMYDLMGIDMSNVNDMTVDGIHPSEQARIKYAGILAEKLVDMGAEKSE